MRFGISFLFLRFCARSLPAKHFFLYYLANRGRPPHFENEAVCFWVALRLHRLPCSPSCKQNSGCYRWSPHTEGLDLREPSNRFLLVCGLSCNAIWIVSTLCEYEIRSTSIRNFDALSLRINNVWYFGCAFARSIEIVPLMFYSSIVWVRVWKDITQNGATFREINRGHVFRAIAVEELVAVTKSEIRLRKPMSPSTRNASNRTILSYFCLYCGCLSRVCFQAPVFLFGIVF